MKIKVSSSIQQFKERAIKTFGLEDWQGVDDPDKELLFFGLYHERDYDVFDRFEGKKSVLWAGSDIIRLTQDYERKRIMKNHPETTHYCENELEAVNLRSVGIEPIIIPSFLDDIDKYQPQFKEGNKHVWMCAHPEREDEYGVPLARRMAKFYPEITFHIYGVEKPEYEDKIDNVKYHGKVPEEQLNEEIKSFHCGFRPNMHDGNSEVTMKSVLLGQYPITRIKYDNIWNYTNEAELKTLFDKLKVQTLPNIIAREYWRNTVNTYPWCKKDGKA